MVWTMRVRISSHACGWLALSMTMLARAEPPPAPSVSEPSPAHVTLDASALASSEQPPRRRRARQWDNGPRAVPRARGAAHARAASLGIGGHHSTKQLLWTRPSAELMAAVPGERPRALLWPVVGGKWGRGFGFTRRVRSELRHNGIDIGAPAGTAVRAAAGGLVIYSDNTLRHLGNAVLVLHPGGWTTLYAHNARTTVQAGWYVKRGERIALVGQTGAAWGPHVHFELRDNGRWIDPAPYLVGYRDEELNGPLVELAPGTKPERSTAVGNGSEEELTAKAPQTPRGKGESSHLAAAAPRRPNSPTLNCDECDANTATAVPAEEPEGEAVQLPLFDYGSLAAVRRVLRGKLPQAEQDALGRRFSNLLLPVKGGTLGRGFERGAHRAIDVMAEPGAAVRAAADGVVLYSGPGILEGLHAVVLLHREGWVTVYGAVREDGAAEAGTRVLRGEWIGRVAERAAGASELHFVWHVAGAPSDPTPLLIGQ
jgi:murein DD-endopeptidase MepM/ murein hydrolase activator NlpD